MAPHGTCHLCLGAGPLSFEHFPPHSCSNSVPMRAWTLRDVQYNRRKTARFPRGLGRYSLCGKCNNELGSRYVPSLQEFTRQGVLLLDRAFDDPSIYATFTIRPLLVLKQVVAMMLAACDFGPSS